MRRWNLVAEHRAAQARARNPQCSTTSLRVHRSSERIFGPVAPVVHFDDVDEAVALANDTETGLAGYVYTMDLAKELAVSEQVQTAMIGLNRGAVSDPRAPSAA